ncbi:hypothetical protein GCM10009737_08300 [Nocardioides lentus]|uniref:Uncharacterized protein n=1 Tax=Nocardioides lentus TaxID=338077 RepID=A0ABP5ABG2_9ACTN
MTATMGELIHFARWVEALELTLAVGADGGGRDPLLSVPVLGWNDVPGWDGNPSDPARFPASDGVPPRKRWLQLSLTRGSIDADLMGGQQRRIKWYLQTLAVASTADEVRMIRDRVHQHRNRRVPIPHGSPLRLAEEDAVRQLPNRGGLYEGESTWWYATRP